MKRQLDANSESAVRRASQLESLRLAIQTGKALARVGQSNTASRVGGIHAGTVVFDGEHEPVLLASCRDSHVRRSGVAPHAMMQRLSLIHISEPTRLLSI